MKQIKALVFLVILVMTSIATQAQDEEIQYRPAQLTFFTPLGTNGLESGECVNNLSVNMLWGLSAGVNGAEFGGIGNSVKGDVRGIQVGGIFNTVGGDLLGIQAAGILNSVKGDILGVQISNFANITMGDVVGLQAAGFMNAADDVKFLQVAGFMNRADNLQGIQSAGFMNIADEMVGAQASGFMNTSDEMLGLQAGGFMNIADEATGVQGAGFMNIADEVVGFQAGGFMNVADELTGVQASGFMNVADEVTGAQVSGFLNVADELKGAQIGFINVCDTVECGVPIGFISIVKHGYRSFEIGTSESWNAYLSYKIGIDRLYNIFSFGTRFISGGPYWGWGYGLGTRFGMGSYLSGSVEIISYQVRDQIFDWDNDFDLHNVARFTVEGKIGGKVDWFAGPTFNVLVSYDGENEVNEIPDIFPLWQVYDQTNGDTRIQMWPGFAAGIRF